MEPSTTTDGTQPTPILDIIRKAGLTESQARGYLALIKHGTLTPTELADHTSESRTNAYMICEKLEKLGLATKTDAKKSTYKPSHPTALETLAEKRRKALVRNEQEVKNGLSNIIDIFYASSEMPGTRTLQGIEGIKEVYADTLSSSNKTILLLRTSVDGPTLGHDFFDDYRKKRAAAGIDTYALTPMTEISHRHVRAGEDEKMRYFRTAIPLDSYTAPVEIDVYGKQIDALIPNEMENSVHVQYARTDPQFYKRRLGLQHQAS